MHGPAHLEPGRGRTDLYKKLLEEIRNTPDIEGITILGGEPLDQATALLALLKEIRATPLNVLLFTGYETEKLSDPEQLEILSLCDIIIDGPYREELKDLSRPLIGSFNQRLRFVSNRYTEADWEQLPRQIEVRVNKEGNITINGMWDKEWMEKFLKDL